MPEKPIHVIWTLANNTTAPYFTWFAERAHKEKDIQLSFVALYPTRPKMIDEMEVLGHKTYWLPFDQGKRKKSFLKVIFPLVKLFRKLKPDVVHAHLFDDALPVLIAARITGVRVRVITKGDASFHWYYAKKGIKYDRLNNRNATHIVAISEESKEFILEKEKADPKRVHLIHHGMPREHITEQSEEMKKNLRKRFEINNDSIVIGTVCRLIEWKGYRHIIGAAEILVKKYPNLKFLFIGQGDQKNELEKLIQEKNLTEKIIFTGWIERNEMSSIYGLMDIYLHAAALEPFGLAIVEAMLNGIPVVSTSTGAARDAITNGENGYLVSAQNAESIVEGVSFMLQNDRKKIGQAGRITAEDIYSIDKMYEKHIALYKQALDLKQ